MLADAPTRRNAAIIGAAAILIVAVAGIVIFGGIALPSVPTAAEAPDPDRQGLVAATTRDDGEECVTVIDVADGSARTLTCHDGWISHISWRSPSTVLVEGSRRGGGGYDETVWDVHTGEVVDRPTNAVSDHEPDFDRVQDVERNGRRVFVADRDDVPTVEIREPDGTEHVVLSSPSPRTYRYRDAWWGADGWLLVLDSGGRLLVVDVEDGSAVEIARDVSRARWQPADPGTG